MFCMGWLFLLNTVHHRAIISSLMMISDQRRMYQLQGKYNDKLNQKLGQSNRRPTVVKLICDPVLVNWI